MTTEPSWNRMKLGLRPMRSASWPKTQMPAIMPSTVTAVQSEDLVRLKPSCLDRKLGIQIMMP
ncbi:hypothetical protein D3C86_1370340 [compost metagenome]